MHKSLLGVIALAALLTGLALAPRPSTSPAPAASAFSVDSVHSFVVFRCKHLNTSYAYGMFNKISGTVNWDEAEAAGSSLELEVATDSVNSGNSKRDTHLKSGDFFAASEFPKATFKSKSVKKAGDNAFDVTGDFTLHGVTKEIAVKLEKTGQGKDRNGGDLIGFESTFTVNRADYGIKFMPDGLGSEVRITVSLECGKK